MLPKDPFMLLSTVNMKLRDNNWSLAELCEIESIDKDDLIQKLKVAGFTYMPEINQFR